MPASDIEFAQIVTSPCCLGMFFFLFYFLALGLEEMGCHFALEIANSSGSDS